MLSDDCVKAALEGETLTFGSVILIGMRENDVREAPDFPTDSHGS